ncbi:MAG: hypothetical protein M1820_003461 [Bogoriella megaspora]|nr:MAG: hypothetical protein M1820_003461 [Bogoriella megaspora]
MAEYDYQRGSERDVSSDGFNAESDGNSNEPAEDKLNVPGFAPILYGQLAEMKSTLGTFERFAMDLQRFLPEIQFDREIEKFADWCERTIALKLLATMKFSNLALDRWGEIESALEAVVECKKRADRSDPTGKYLEIESAGELIHKQADELWKIREKAWELIDRTKLKEKLDDILAIDVAYRLKAFYPVYENLADRMNSMKAGRVAESS